MNQNSNKNDLIEKYIIETENTNINNNMSLLNNNKESNDIQSKLFKNRIKINKNKSSGLIL
jgi:hypothetical protein